ncbi:type II secretion system protein [Cerasicoccus fimbriatus]|uniref:type II secretion system protein n=1 Tax=Cerasicoccus fimbriatus TaxID=3014554 RepID=UPI0022B35E0B|nr:type II secretion system protein [Cerasicoccus sp. TK19100]
MKNSTAASERRAAFTLVEIMTVIVIIGLLAIMGMPAFQKARITAQNTRLANDLRVFAGAFDNYSAEHGAWPPDYAAGVVPTEMQGYLDPSEFTIRTVVGGRYDWNYNNGTYQAGIAITGSHMDEEQATEVDEMLDDGNLSTGKFQMDGANYVYILEP